MKITKRRIADDEEEFTITLDSIEAIRIVSGQQDAYLRFSAALLKSMEGLPQGVENETCNNKEVQ